MENNAVFGLLFITMAGIFSGTFSTPFKFNKKWQWENNWLIWSFIALLIAPWVVAVFTIPHLTEVYTSESSNLLLVILFGLIWGVGAIMFGKGIDYLGISLSIPIMLGLINTVGTLMPILVNDPTYLLTLQGIKIMIGVAVIVVGIVLFSIAGSKKNPETTDGNKNVSKSIFIKGLIICILAGVFGPMINFAFVFGEPIQIKAIELGASPVFATNAIWSIVLSAGFTINLFYCVFLLKNTGSWKSYKNSSISYWLFAVLAGIIWYLSVMFYGMGCNFMGKLGASVGWATMQTIAIIAGNVAGLMTGEWKGANRNAMKFMFAGLFFLIVGVFIIAL